MIAADQITPVDDSLIPTGDLKPGKGTVFDFTTPVAIGALIGKVPGPAPVGYDHNYVLRKAEGGGRGTEAGAMTLAARVIEPKSGRVMDVRTTEAGLQFL